MGLGNCLKEGYKNLWWVMGTYFGVNNIGTSNAKPSKSLSILIKFIHVFWEGHKIWRNLKKKLKQPPS